MLIIDEKSGRYKSIEFSSVNSTSSGNLVFKSACDLCIEVLCGDSAVAEALCRRFNAFYEMGHRMFDPFEELKNLDKPLVRKTLD